MNKVEKKRIKEQETIEKMIHIYCKKNHHTKELCSDCEELNITEWQGHSIR